MSAACATYCQAAFGLHFRHGAPAGAAASPAGAFPPFRRCAEVSGVPKVVDEPLVRQRLITCCERNFPGASFARSPAKAPGQSAACYDNNLR